MSPRYTLGPARREPFFGNPGAYVRIAEDLRKCVVFVGYDGAPNEGGIHCIGTAFLMIYKNAPYLITAKHIALEFGGDPFLVRVNRHDGG